MITGAGRFALGLLVVAIAAVGFASGAGTSPGGAGGAAGVGRNGRGAVPPAELHDQIVEKYMGGEWETLGVEFAKTKELSAMTKEHQADVVYIRNAVIEGRPAWWNQVKMAGGAGKTLALRPTVWQRTFAANWDPTLNTSLNVIANKTATGQNVTLSVNWPALDMDSKELLGAGTAGIGFTKGDQVSMGMWGTLETAELWIGANLERMSKMTQQERNFLDRYTAFRGMITSEYYGTPSARRFAMWAGVQAIQDPSPGANSRKPAGVMLIAEIVGHPAKYPSIQLAKVLADENTEVLLASNLARLLVRTPLTFGEDRALRDAVKEFAGVNGVSVFNTGKVVLSNKQVVSLDLLEEKELSAKRSKWLAGEQAKPAATKPATRPQGSGGN